MVRHPGGTSPAAAPSKSSLIIKSLTLLPLDEVELLLELELDELELLEFEVLELEELELDELELLELELDELPLPTGSLSAPHASSRAEHVLMMPRRASRVTVLDSMDIRFPVDGAGVGNDHDSLKPGFKPFVVLEIIAESAP